MGSADLSVDSRYPHSSCSGDRSAGDSFAKPRPKRTCRGAQADRSLDLAALDVRLCDRRSDLFSALSDLPAKMSGLEPYSTGVLPVLNLQSRLWPGKVLATALAEAQQTIYENELSISNLDSLDLCSACDLTQR